MKYRCIFAIPEQLLQGTKAFSASCSVVSARELGVHGKLGETQMGQLTLNDPSDVPYHMESWSAHKTGGRRKKG